MRVAKLRNVDTKSRLFTYQLSVPYYVATPRATTSYHSPALSVYSREDFTKVWCCHHREQIKTLGVRSHAQVLENLGYIWRVDSEWVESASDDVLLTCLVEFEKTQDETLLFDRELKRR